MKIHFGTLVIWKKNLLPSSFIAEGDFIFTDIKVSFQKYWIVLPELDFGSFVGPQQLKQQQRYVGQQ